MRDYYRNTPHSREHCASLSPDAGAKDQVHDNVEEEDEEEHPQSDNVVHNVHKSIRALSPKITSY